MKKTNLTKTAASQARILVIIATLGEREEMLRQTLQSIVNQNIDLDIVFVCPLANKSTKNLADEYNAFRIDDPGGISAAVNAGINFAKLHHTYITWIGDDDLLAPDSLKNTTKALDESPDAVLAFGYCHYINSKGSHILTSRAGRFAPWLMTWGPDLIPLPGTLFRASALTKISGFDTSLKYAMDLDIFLRLRKIGRFINVKKVVSSFRWHETSATVSNRTASSSEAERVKRKYMPPAMRFFSVLWEKPIRVASRLAAERVTSLAKKK
jgi:cellulose synthase/poly-beta-1,6-N-acetylglucosamine synthase-like glycosyltransferase